MGEGRGDRERESYIEMGRGCVGGERERERESER